MQEPRSGFVPQKEELEGEYQKQVDNMLFFGYQCYMKKHGITQDTPSYPSNDEDEALGGPAWGMRMLLEPTPLMGRHDSDFFLCIFLFLFSGWSGPTGSCKNNEHSYF